MTTRTVGYNTIPWQLGYMTTRATPKFLLFLVLSFSLDPMLGHAQSQQPEDSTGRGQHQLSHARQYMVAAAHPDAVQAGLTMLRKGGSAADAAIAVQLVLNLVEPQSSGIGGGAFALFHDAQRSETVTYDGRETAPNEIKPKHFLKNDGTPMAFRDAIVGGHSVGTPGTVALLAELHRQHGNLPWAELFEPAINLSKTGFIVGPRLAAMLQGPRTKHLKIFDETRTYFFPGGKPLEAGEKKTNPAFAASLEAIAANGPSAFYRGKLAQAMVTSVRNAFTNPGLLSLSDLNSYEVIRRTPVCHAYRTFRVCGMGPPSSGGLTVGQILGILETFDLPELGPENPRSWHLLNEASKLAFADRNQYMADADFVPVPIKGLLDRDYLAKRAGFIREKTSIIPPMKPGNPAGAAKKLHGTDTHNGRPGTSHISIIDVEGNALSMTTTIEGAFGSQIMVGGFLLNNELTDFSFFPEKDGAPVANRIAPGKRPRSSMSPTIVFDKNNELRLVVGSPGGSRIIGYVAKTLVAVLDWDMDIQSAINLGHLVNRNQFTDLESGTSAVAFQATLEALGNRVKIRDMNSGLHGIEVLDGQLRGGADQRREGVAQGD
ncbi:MAG: gamma-glutamyltransferase [Alphaproteobacteria bacterium]|nr:gamma-glutamyltransferase [Alphaproteobacteria bacterium]